MGGPAGIEDVGGGIVEVEGAEGVGEGGEGEGEAGGGGGVGHGGLVWCGFGWIGEDVRGGRGDGQGGC